MLSHPFSRSTAIFRNALGYRPIARFFATRSPFPCKVCQTRLSQFWGSVQAKHQQTNRFAAEAERQHEQPGAPILAALRIAHHGTGPVIHLCFFTSFGEDHRTGFRRLDSAQLANEAFDALIAASESVLIDQVLPDGHGIAAARQTQLDRFAVRIAGAGWAGRTRGIAGSKAR